MVATIALWLALACVGRGIYNCRCKERALFKRVEGLARADGLWGSMDCVRNVRISVCRYYTTLCTLAAILTHFNFPNCCSDLVTGDRTGDR